jgi:hypothetical protein
MFEILYRLQILFNDLIKHELHTCFTRRELPCEISSANR